MCGKGKQRPETTIASDMKHVLLLSSLCLAATALSSCQSYTELMTPSARISSDSFDGAKVINQPPVSAAASMSENWHTLGFDWNSRTPDKVFVTAGAPGTQNIFGLAFNAGGKVITAQPTSLMTEFGVSSTRRFVMNYRDFETIATAPSVKMKVSGANSDGVSSFGTSTKALVNTKFPSFLQQVQAVR